MNTRIEYLYRDASNYKYFDEVVVSGVLSIDQILPFLRDGEYFIPSKVGLDDLQPEKWTEDDHIWHEIDVVKLTSDDVTMNVDANEILKKFRAAQENDWYEFVGDCSRNYL